MNFKLFGILVFFILNSGIWASTFVLYPGFTAASSTADQLREGYNFTMSATLILLNVSHVGSGDNAQDAILTDENGNTLAGPYPFVNGVTVAFNYTLVNGNSYVIMPYNYSGNGRAYSSGESYPVIQTNITWNNARRRNTDSGNYYDGGGGAEATPIWNMTVASDLMFLLSNTTIDDTTDHSFIATFVVNNSFGGINVTSWNWTITSGSCANYSNSTSGPNATIKLNCTGTVPATPTLSITINDTVNKGSVVGTITHAFLDNPHVNSVAVLPANPDLTIPSLVCQVNMTSSIDNTFNGTVNWFINGVNQTALAITNTSYSNNTIANISTVLTGNFSANENISCSVFGNDTGSTSFTIQSANVTESNGCVNITANNTVTNLYTNLNIGSLVSNGMGMCMNITGNNDTLNLNGFVINGSDGYNGTTSWGDTAIYVNGTNDIIENGTLMNWQSNVYFDTGANGSTAENIIITNSSVSGGTSSIFVCNPTSELTTFPAWYGFYTNAYNTSILNNSISNITMRGAGSVQFCGLPTCARAAASQGTIYGIYAGVNTTTISGNNMSNFTAGVGGNGLVNTPPGDCPGCTAGSSGGLLYPIYLINAVGDALSNNLINNWTGANGGTSSCGTVTASNVYGIYAVSGNNSNFSSNNVDNLSTTATPSQGKVSGISVAGPFNYFINNNNQLSAVNNTTEYFYSNTSQNITSILNTGWWPLGGSNGSNAYAQINTSYYNGSGGGLNANLTTNTSNTFWYAGPTPFMTPTVAYYTTVIQGFEVVFGTVNVSLINWTLYVNGTSFATGNATNGTLGFPPGQNISLFNLTNFVKNSNLTLSADEKLVNGTVYSYANSSNLTINDSLPAITNIYMNQNSTNGPWYYNQTFFNATVTVQDNDTVTDTTTLYCSWYDNGVNQTSLFSTTNGLTNGSTTVINASPSFPNSGDVWYVSCTPYDGQAYGDTVNSTNLTISAPPIIPVPTVPNITVYWNISNSSYNAIIEISTDNSTWMPINGTPANGTTPWTWLGTLNQTSQSFTLNRQIGPIYLRGREEYQSMFTSWSYLTLNATPTNVSVNASVVPNTSSVNQSHMEFYCTPNRTTVDNKTAQNALVQVVVNGVAHNATFNVSAQNYYYIQTIPQQSGFNTWNCTFSKPNYYNATSTTGNFTYGDFVVDLPNGVTSVRFFCPFPTYLGALPWGQTAGIGVLKVTTINQSRAFNYSINATAFPANVSVYARNNWTNTSSWYSWNPTSLNVSGTAQLVIYNVSPNSSAYIWMHANCNASSPVNSFPVNYTITEQ